jgi:hypothetical protein
MDVQSWLASLRPQLSRWHRDLMWLASSACLLGAAASGVAAWSMTALAASTWALAYRRRPLDLDPAWACSRESMAAPLAMSKLDWRVSMRVVELAERGAHAAPGVFVLGHLVEENEARPFQGLCDLDGVDDVVEWCAQVHDGNVRGVLL